MELKDIRTRIDAIDDELVRLFARRMDCAAEVARTKQTTGKPIRDPAREREILNRLTAAAGDAYAPYVRTLYNQILDLTSIHLLQFGLLFFNSISGERLHQCILFGLFTEF